MLSFFTKNNLLNSILILDIDCNQITIVTNTPRTVLSYFSKVTIFQEATAEDDVEFDEEEEVAPEETE